MYSSIEIALINAVMIVPLAFIAEVTGRVLRRPALTHLLWVLILLKLLTPPIWQIPLINPDWLTSATHKVVNPVIAEVDRFGSERRTIQGKSQSTTTVSRKAKPRPRTLAEQDQRAAIQRASSAAVVARWVRSESFRELVFTGLLLVWGLGASIWFALQGFRCLRFRLLLSQGTAAGSELQQFSNELAGRLGLKASPTVWLMPGVMSPMLWGSGQSSLLIFPELLLDRLDEEATGTLLTHELAHYRRRDHLVRIVALVATGFFWWHPIVWYARRAIEAVEEECCDALVLKAATAPPKRYAEALLDTVDFLAEFQLKLPPLATGLGQLPFLRQRLTWIMRGPRKQDFGYCGRVLCLLLAGTLPWQPTWLAAHSPVPMAIPASPAAPHRIDVPRYTSPSAIDDEAGLSIDITAVSPSMPNEATAIPPRWKGFTVRSQSFDGRFVVMGNKQSQFLLDLESGHEMDLSDFVIKAMAFSPNTYQFVTIGEDRCLRLWNAEAYEVVKSWHVPGGPSKSVDISWDGRWIATGGRDGVIRIWNEASAQHVEEMPRELAPVNCLRFSPDSSMLAVATGDWMSTQSGRIALFEVGSWSERISMNWNSPAAVVAFHADGESLTSGDWQGRIARWSIANGELLGLAHGQKDLVAAAEFSPNGSALAEIEVPDLEPDATWGEEPSNDQFQWLFRGLPVKSQASPSAPRPSGGMAP